MTFTRSFYVTFLAVMLLAVGFAAGYLANDYLNPLTEFKVFNEAYNLLMNNGLNEAPAAPALEYGMIRGMLQAYADPYTVFVEPAQHELQSNNLQGSFGGIGVELSLDPDGYWALFPYPDGPAQIAGVQNGDRLLAVEKLPVGLETPVHTIQSEIRGPVGQRVKLTIGRPPDYTPQEVSIKRAEIALPSVTWRLDMAEPSAGVIEVHLIAASTADEIKRAVEELQAQGATHFVLDLRDNPGGLLVSGVDVARLFLRKGLVLEQQYRDREVESYRVERPGPLVDIPLVVLINNRSASAAEIIAGALKVNGRATLVGSPSFGKDSIQLVYNLSDNSSLHVTAARWWVPGLEPPLGGIGLQPDVLVEQPAEETGQDEALSVAIRAVLGTK